MDKFNRTSHVESVHQHVFDYLVYMDLTTGKLETLRPKMSSPSTAKVPSMRCPERQRVLQSIVIMRFTDAFLAIPGLLLSLLMVGIVGPGLWTRARLGGDLPRHRAKRDRAGHHLSEQLTS